MTGSAPRPPAVLAIGRNYAAHAAEMGAAPPEGLMLFFKNPASVVLGGPIRIPAVCREHGPQVDFEGELCVELGRDLRDASAEESLAAVAGYRVANDVSARWWQKEGAGGQFCRGKGFDTFCPVSALAPRDSVGDTGSLRLKTFLNGEVMQDDTTASMIWPLGRLLSELSRGTTLLAGTFVLTGTPAGVGAQRKPPRFLRHGDVVEVEIERVGRLRSEVIEE